MKRALLQLRDLLNGGASTAYDLACAEALAGDRDEALRWLEAVADMGQHFDLNADPDLASLHGSPRLETIQKAMQKNLQPITHSELVATLHDPTLLVEDITYRRDTNSFLLTSVLKHKVLELPRKPSAAEDYAFTPFTWPLLAISVDHTGEFAWITTAAMPGFSTVPADDSGKTMLRKLSLKTGEVVASFSPDDPPHVLGDLAVGPKGEVVVSDGRAGAVYLLRPGATKLERIDRDQFISPQTPAFADKSNLVFIADYVRGIAKLNLSTGDIEWIHVPDNMTIHGIDGLYFHGGKLIAVQNGSTPPRIIELKLDHDQTFVTRIDVLEANWTGLGEPTHGVFVGDEFYFIANSGWSALDGKGELKPDQKMTPATIWRLKRH